MGAGRAALVSISLAAGCTVEPGASDGGPPDAPPSPVDARGDAPRDGGSDAPDGGPPRCEDVPLEPWDLTLGTWSPDLGPRGLSLDGPRGAFVWDLAALGGVLYVAGDLTHAGPIPARGVARWTLDEGWAALGDGVPGSVRLVTVALDGRVFVAAVDGPPAGWTIHAFEAGSWRLVGTADGEVEALAADVDGTVLAGGFFRSIDGVSAPDAFARWDGSAWTAIAQPGFDVGAIRVAATEICVGGRDFSAGYVACQARGETTWDFMAIPPQPGPPFPDPVNAILHDESGRVVVGGGVYLGDDLQHGGVVRWSGTEFGLLGEGLSDRNAGMEVYDLARTSDGAIYAVGTFSMIGSYLAPRGYPGGVAAYASGFWQDFGGVQGFGWDAARAAVADARTLYVGGAMTEAYTWRGFHAVAGIVRFVGGAWSALEHPGTPAHGPHDVYSLGVRGSCPAVVSGGFQTVEDEAIEHVGMLDASLAMHPVSTETGFDYAGPRVLAVAPDGTIWGGGSFTLERPGSTARLPLVRNVDGEWEPAIGFTTSDRVTALAIDEMGVVTVGGLFADAADPARSHLRRWDGSTWSAVGARTDPQPVSALGLDGDALVVAEDLSMGGTVGPTRISRFEGGAWTVLDPPIDASISALAVHRGALVAAGERATGAVVVRRDGSAWTEIGSFGDAYTTISSLAVLGDALVAAGGDTVSLDAPGLLLRRTDTGWEELGGGVDGYVDALVFTRDGLLVGGRFDVAGGTPAWGLALLRRP